LSGNLVWTKQFGTAGTDSGNAMFLHSTGLYVAGTTDGTFNGQTYSGAQDVFVVRFADIALRPITTVAGNGTAGFSGDGNQAVNAQLNSPAFAVFDSAGNLYISDNQNHRVRKVTPGGVISTVAGTGNTSYVAAQDGGAATSANLNSPTGLVFDSSGNLYITEYSNNRVRRVTPGGVISTFAGNGTQGQSGLGGQATSAQVSGPTGLAIDSAGSIYIAEYNNHRVLKVATNGIITKVAGTGTPGYNGDGFAATSASLNNPYGLAIDAAGNLYVADRGNNRIRKIDASTGLISTIAGTGAAGYGGDGGAAVNAQLGAPCGIAFDAAGNLYIADLYNYRVRKITGTLINTIAGTGAVGYGGDNGPALSGILNLPNGVTVDSSGNLYVVEYYGHRVRKVSTLPSIQ
jgi:sugar lactone lactonase YvrE